MKIGVIGATGFVGKMLVDKASKRGHHVRALVRTPSGLGDLAGRVEALQGDMFDPAKLQELVHGVDAVISTAGPPLKGRHDSLRYREAMDGLIGAMKGAGVQRLMIIAGAAARLPGESLGFKRSLLRLVLSTFVMPDVLRTKDLEVQRVAESGLSWTIIRPPRIGKGKPSGKVIATDRTLAGTKVDVEDITDFMLDELERGEWLRRAPTVAS